MTHPGTGMRKRVQAGENSPCERHDPTWHVTDDWPSNVPVSAAEVTVTENYLSQDLGRLIRKLIDREKPPQGKGQSDAGGCS